MSISTLGKRSWIFLLGSLLVDFQHCFFTDLITLEQKEKKKGENDSLGTYLTGGRQELGSFETRWGDWNGGFSSKEKGLEESVLWD